MATSTWRLNSNSGRESVAWEVRGHAPGQEGRAFLCDIHFAGQYFGATLAGRDPELRDYSLRFDGMAVGVAELDRICSVLEAWLQLPLADQSRQRPDLQCNVGSLFDQSLTLLLGNRADRLSGGKPVATLRYIAGSLTGELVFVTDQTCLQELASGIRAALGRSLQ